MSRMPSVTELADSVKQFTWVEGERTFNGNLEAEDSEKSDEAKALVRWLLG